MKIFRVAAMGVCLALVAHASDIIKVEQPAIFPLMPTSTAVPLTNQLEASTVSSVKLISEQKPKALPPVGSITPIQLSLAGFCKVPWHVDDVRGLSLGLIANTDNTVSGLQVALALNAVNSFSGLQISFLMNGGRGQTMGQEYVSVGNLYGTRLGWGQAPMAGDMNGVQLCFFKNSVGGDVRGLQIAFGNLAFKDMDGMQVGIEGNGVGGKMRGTQISLINLAGEINGLQVGCYNQVGFLTNPIGNLKGLQIGVGNKAREVKGVQIGVVNYTEILHGLQIGLVNIATESPLPFFPIINAHY